MKRFGLIGVAGFIAPRHLRAIRETGNELVVAMDINDSVGIMDSHFPASEFFTEFEQFESFIEDEKLSGKCLDYISICSPNYLHLPHIKVVLRNGINVICEKPLVLNTGDLDTLKEYEKHYDARVYTILQLRLHPSILELRDRVRAAPPDEIFDVELTYITARGKWYMRSWKAVDEKSGGVATNIGVHFFDMLHFIFGELRNSEVHFRNKKSVIGYSEYERARVKWLLSIEPEMLPDNAVEGEKMTYRSIKIAGQELEFSGGFTDLHTKSYENILVGKGFGIEENRTAIESVQKIRSEDLSLNPTATHHLFAKVIS